MGGVVVMTAVRVVTIGVCGCAGVRACVGGVVLIGVCGCAWARGRVGGRGSVVGTNNNININDGRRATRPHNNDDDNNNKNYGNIDNRDSNDGGRSSTKHNNNNNNNNNNNSNNNSNICSNARVVRDERWHRLVVEPELFGRVGQHAV